MVINKKITRGIVHVIPHKYNGVYNVLENGDLCINIEQIEIHRLKEKIGMTTVKKTAFISGEFESMFNMEYKSNQGLPGNIHIIEQTEPVIEDSPEEYLYWNEDKTMVHRDNSGNAIYRYQLYYPNEPYNTSGHIDTLLTT